jgi:tRNA pseudouridine synthase 10
MSVSQKAFLMLEKYPLCDHCLGRQFALLGYSLENNRRGEALKIELTLQASADVSENETHAVKVLKVLATNGFSPTAQATLKHLNKRLPKTDELHHCFLCDAKFAATDSLLQKVQDALAPYEFSTFLVGVEIPVAIAEREDEFKAAFSVQYSESLKP